MFQEPNTINECFTAEDESKVLTKDNVANTIDTKMMSKYKNYIAASGNNAATIATIDSNSTEKIDELLEKEKQQMSSEPWNKLDKRLKIQKLHAYAEKFGKDNSFSECLTKDKLSKVKDVDYDRDMGVITNIGSLFLNLGTRTFTLRNLDKKVSTLKMLTPKKIVSQNDTDK